MNTNEIIGQLRAERDRLDAAIQALEAVGVGSVVGVKRRGRPPGKPNKAATTGGTRPRRVMSAAARKRIADAMRKRWATAKKSGKTRL